MMDLAGRLTATLHRPDAQAVEFAGRWWSWADLRGAADALNKAIGPAAPGALVALLPRNRPGHLAALFGLLAAGRSLALVNPMQGAAQIAAQLAQLRPLAVVADAEDVASPALAGAGTLLVVDGMRVSVAARGPRLATGGPQQLSLLTSGTTGPSKRIALSAGAVLNAAEDCAAIEAEGGGDRPLFVSAYSLTNIGGVYYAMPSGVTGRPLVLLEKFSVLNWVEAVARHRPGLLWLPPAAVRMVLDASVPPDVLASARALRFGSAPLEPEAMARFEATYGMPVLAQYGATEFAGTITAMTLADLHSFGAAKRGSVGRPRPGISLRVVDPGTGAELPPGTVGRLEARVPRISSSWLATSDHARLDLDGFLFLASRADEAINRGGFKVLPEEVAAVLRRHPAVADAVVVGFPDRRLGEVPVAAVEPRTGADLDAAEILGFARNHLVAYQVPARLLVVPALPRTVSMKADRPAVRRLFDA